jgi:hypothetical protein
MKHIEPIKPSPKEGLRERLEELTYTCFDYERVNPVGIKLYLDSVMEIISEQGVPEKDDMEIFSGEDKRTMRKTLDKSIGWNAAIDEMKRRLT